MEQVQWQEQVSLVYKKSQEKYTNFRHVRYCTHKEKKKHLENHFKFFNCWLAFGLVFGGSLFSASTDAFFHFLLIVFANHLKVLFPLMNIALWHITKMDPML